MCLVVLILDRAAALRLVDGTLHRPCNDIAVHDDVSARIACGAPDGLDERCIRAQKALLVRIEDGNERYLGHIQSLAQQVDADEHVELARSQVVDDLRTLDGRDVRVEVAHLHPRLA